VDNALARQISNHLEFLGYEIEDKSTADECGFTATTSDRNPNLFVDVNKDNLVIIRTFWGPWKHEVLDNPAFFSLINTANMASSYSKWYSYESTNDNTVNIVVETWFFGYDKKSFGGTFVIFPGR
jgi:hypothetical protein